MYEIAKHHRNLAKERDRKDMRAEVEESMISILFSYTCLEAYINTVGRDNLGPEWPRYEKGPRESKLRGVANALATRKAGKRSSPFNKNKEPLRSFRELQKIRDELIVHRKAEFMDIANTKYGRTEGTINTFNCDKAQWSCTVVKEMVRRLNENIDKPPLDDWLE
jgi:hypothetical protein